jgi:hypothetical protein
VSSGRSGDAKLGRVERGHATFRDRWRVVEGRRERMLEAEGVPEGGEPGVEGGVEAGGMLVIAKADGQELGGGELEEALAEAFGSDVEPGISGVAKAEEGE